MEIRDPVHGTLAFTDAEVAIVDSLAYQRLRAIKQLGFAEFSYPGATHNRYIHSIGVAHLAGVAFDKIFAEHKFSSSKVAVRLRQCVRLAAMLHDIGHGPLSHTTEQVMPNLQTLNLKAYSSRRDDIPLSERARSTDRIADHEDYTIKFITDSSLTETLEKSAPDMSPLHIACLIDKTLAAPDDFFIDGGLDFRAVLSQVVSSEMDVDRMDYLERDAYFCGTNYGRVELSWLLANMSFHAVDDQAYLALNRRALYSFDDFLLARHHMHLMVYFHHKAIIYEEFLHRYLSSDDCSFHLPSNIEEYIHYTDYALYQHLSSVDNVWARRITERDAFSVVFELHSTEETDRVAKMEQVLKGEGLEVILASTMARLSKYHSAAPEEKSFPIYVVDRFDRQSKPYPIEQSTQIFQKYEEIRRIERLYVAPGQYKQAEQILLDKKL